MEDLGWDQGPRRLDSAVLESREGISEGHRHVEVAHYELRTFLYCSRGRGIIRPTFEVRLLDRQIVDARGRLFEWRRAGQATGKERGDDGNRQRIDRVMANLAAFRKSFGASVIAKISHVIGGVAFQFRHTRFCRAHSQALSSKSLVFLYSLL